MKDKKELLKYLKNITVLYVEDDKNTREELEFFLNNRVDNYMLEQMEKRELSYSKNINPI